MFERVQKKKQTRSERDKKLYYIQSRVCYVRKSRIEPRNINRNKRSRFECLIIVLIESNKEFKKKY